MNVVVKNKMTEEEGPPPFKKSKSETFEQNTGSVSELADFSKSYQYDLINELPDELISSNEPPSSAVPYMNSDLNNIDGFDFMSSSDSISCLNSIINPFLAVNQNLKSSIDSISEKPVQSNNSYDKNLKCSNKSMNNDSLRFVSDDVTTTEISGPSIDESFDRNNIYMFLNNCSNDKSNTSSTFNSNSILNNNIPEDKMVRSDQINSSSNVMLTDQFINKKVLNNKPSNPIKVESSEFSVPVANDGRQLINLGILNESEDFNQYQDNISNSDFIEQPNSLNYQYENFFGLANPSSFLSSNQTPAMINQISSTYNQQQAINSNACKHQSNVMNSINNHKLGQDIVSNTLNANNMNQVASNQQQFQSFFTSNQRMRQPLDINYYTNSAGQMSNPAVQNMNFNYQNAQNSIPQFQQQLLNQSNSSLSPVNVKSQNVFNNYVSSPIFENIVSFNQNLSSIQQTNIVSDYEKKRLIQQQLIMLLHAHKCHQREIAANESGITQQITCAVPHCSTMRNVIQHIVDCRIIKNCPVPHCCSSRQIISHWRSCKQEDCPICQPLRSPPDNGRINNLSENLLGNIDVAQQSEYSFPNRPTDMLWQHTVQHHVRNKLVQKIVSAICPFNETISRQDKRLKSLIDFACQLEHDIFTNALSKDDYFHKLAGRVYKIQKDVHEKRQRRFIDQHLQNQSTHQNQHFPLIRQDTSLDCQPLSVHSQSSIIDGNNSTKFTLHHAANSNIINSPNCNDVKVPFQTLPCNQSQMQMSQHINSSPIIYNELNADMFGQNANMIIKNENKSVESIKIPSGNEVVIKITAVAANSNNIPVKNFEFKRIWKPDELRHAFIPVWERVYTSQPESLPFQQPVDPIALGIPDYFDIVKKPTDLSTIRKNLENGVYNNPWQFVDDMWLMFDNAWLYNKKTSRVYKFCTKLAEIFEPYADAAMWSFGLCCGRKYVFFPQVIYCYGKDYCSISRDTAYYSYDNRFVYCERCFNEISGDLVYINDENGQRTIPKTNFSFMRNNVIESEPMVECKDCGIQQHQICVIHLDSSNPGGYLCPVCLHRRNISKKENKYTAKKLAVTNLSQHIEDNLNKFLVSNGFSDNQVIIRLVSNVEKVVEVKSIIRSRYDGPTSFPESFPYKAKALFAFQIIDGEEVCFFGMHVQEYGSDCPEPNSRRVYLSYLDSVFFFQPKHLRTAVYHTILISYFDYCRLLGYDYAHIWSCPPCEGDDYMFHCHPNDQKIPKHRRLVDWYRTMLDNAMHNNIIKSYRDMHTYCTEEKITSLFQIPYFEGDFWPNTIEDSIREIDNETQEFQLSASPNNQFVDLRANNGLIIHSNSNVSSKTNKKTSKKYRGSPARSTMRKSLSSQTTIIVPLDLSSRILQTVEKYREMFLVVQLQQISLKDDIIRPLIIDQDPIIVCDLMDGRGAFLALCRERHWEFSSLRRCKYSTVAMLVELHTQGTDKFMYTCNSCKVNIETRYHCIECEDFDLCQSCFNAYDHEHPMEKLGFDLDECDSTNNKTAELDSVSNNNGNYVSQSNHLPTDNYGLVKYLLSLVHTSVCNDCSCQFLGCSKMKKVVQHARECSKKMTGGCLICRQLITLCVHHAKVCKDENCRVAYCQNIKIKLREQQMHQRFQQSQMIRRRMAAMQQRQMQIVSANNLANSNSPSASQTINLAPQSVNTIVSGSFNNNINNNISGKTAGKTSLSPLTSRTTSSTLPSGKNMSVSVQPNSPVNQLQFLYQQQLLANQMNQKQCMQSNSPLGFNQSPTILSNNLNIYSSSPNVNTQIHLGQGNIGSPLVNIAQPAISSSQTTPMQNSSAIALLRNLQQVVKTLKSPTCSLAQKQVAVQYINQNPGLISQLPQPQQQLFLSLIASFNLQQSHLSQQLNIKPQLLNNGSLIGSSISSNLTSQQQAINHMQRIRQMQAQQRQAEINLLQQQQHQLNMLQLYGNQIVNPQLRAQLILQQQQNASALQFSNNNPVTSAGIVNLKSPNSVTGHLNSSSNNSGQVSMNASLINSQLHQSTNTFQALSSNSSQQSSQFSSLVLPHLSSLNASSTTEHQSSLDQLFLSSLASGDFDQLSSSCITNSGSSPTFPNLANPNSGVVSSITINQTPNTNETRFDQHSNPKT